jgi:NDP-sugar pyrophosphorylase family protein
LTKGMILAAGEGKRLRPLTLSRPKPIVPVNNRPLLSYTLKMARRIGLKEVAVNVCWRADDIIAELGDGTPFGLSINYSREEKMLGTAGGVKKVASLFTDDFLVLYGDTFCEIEIDNLLEIHRREEADATIGLFAAEDPSVCGIVELGEGNRVAGFVEKPPKGTEKSNAANAGVYLLSPRVLDLIPENQPCDFGLDVFPSLLESEARVFADFVRGYLSDTGTFELYKRVNFDVAASRGRSGCRAGLLRGSFCAPQSFGLVGRVCRRCRVDRRGLDLGGPVPRRRGGDGVGLRPGRLSRGRGRSDRGRFGVVAEPGGQTG